MRGGRNSAFPRCRQLRMTAETDHNPSRQPVTAHEPARRGGSIILVLLVAGGIVAVAIVLMTIGRAQAQPYILGLLALLAMAGLFSLFAYAAGLTRSANPPPHDPANARTPDPPYTRSAPSRPT